VCVTGGVCVCVCVCVITFSDAFSFCTCVLSPFREESDLKCHLPVYVQHINSQFQS